MGSLETCAVKQETTYTWDSLGPSKIRGAGIDDQAKYRLSFTQGFILGQLSVVFLLAAFIKFFIFGDAPSAEVTASTRATERRSRTLAHRQSLLKLRPENQQQRQQSTTTPTPTPTPTTTVNKKKSSILRNPPPLTIESILEKTYYNVDSHQPESLDWFNVLIAQTLAQFRSDAQHDDAILDSLTNALNGTGRPDLLDDIRITELTLGEDFPILSNCRIIPVDEDGLTLDGGPGGGGGGGRKTTSASDANGARATPREGAQLQARMDVDLSDMITLALETKLLLNYPQQRTAVLPVALAVSVVRFSGTLCLSFIPSNASQARPTMTMAFNFLDDYRLDLSIRSLVGSRSRLQDVPKIAQIVEARLHAWFDDRCVEPRFQQIALPNMWPRKENTRGGDDDDPDVTMAAIGSIGKAKARDLGRDLREEARIPPAGPGAGAQTQTGTTAAATPERGPAPGNLRYRAMNRMDSNREMKIPGALPGMGMAL